MSEVNESTATPTGRRGVIDQIEGDLVTIVFDDNNEQLVVDRRTLPPNSRVGDVVTLKTPDATIGAQAAGAAEPTIEVDSAETEAAKERVRQLIDDIFKKQP